MIEYRHHVSGFFSNRDAAKIAFSKLLEQGLPRERLQIFETDSAASAPAPKADRSYWWRTPGRFRRQRSRGQSSRLRSATTKKSVTSTRSK